MTFIKLNFNDDVNNTAFNWGFNISYVNLPLLQYIYCWSSIKFYWFLFQKWVSSKVVGEVVPESQLNRWATSKNISFTVMGTCFQDERFTNDKGEIPLVALLLARVTIFPSRVLPPLRNAIKPITATAGEMNARELRKVIGRLYCARARIS